MTEALLKGVGADFRSTLIIIRWINFLHENVPASQVPRLFEYYENIGWISKETRNHLTEMALGMKPRDEIYEQYPLESFIPGKKEVEEVESFESVIEEKYRLRIDEAQDWRLDSEDHLKSYLFIQELVGDKVNKDEWNAIELRIDQFRHGLRGFYGV